MGQPVGFVLFVVWLAENKLSFLLCLALPFLLVLDMTSPWPIQNEFPLKRY